MAILVSGFPRATFSFSAVVRHRKTLPPDEIQRWSDIMRSYYMAMQAASGLPGRDREVAEREACEQATKAVGSTTKWASYIAVLNDSLDYTRLLISRAKKDK